jgi:hypothetical protein
MPTDLVCARDESTTFLVEALAEARRRHLVPSHGSRRQTDRFEGPWPSRWPCQEIAASDSARPFVAALRVGYPRRFGEVSKFYYKDPEQYVAAFLRAVITDSVVRGGPPRA